MKTCNTLIKGALFCLGMLLVVSNSFAADSAVLVSMSVPSNSVVKPRTIFYQTWTLRNNGTTTWTPGHSGCTLNMISNDYLGAIPLSNNSTAHRYDPTGLIDSGKSIAPNATCTYTLMFIAPEAAGSYTDYFQLNSAASVFFGPPLVVQITVPPLMGNTNQYDRAKAVSYANNYAGFICSDGYFWTNSSDYHYYGTNVAVPTNLVGDDCAHFVSCCIGREAHHWGGGIYIPSRTAPSYGEPGASEIVNTVLIAAGYAKEVFSESEMVPGDVVGWNWEGNPSIGDLDHVTFYLGNTLLASHANSALDVSADTWYQTSTSVRHLVHIFDAPTINYAVVSKKLVLSWGTNWAGYVLQSSPSIASNATWTKVTTNPTKVGARNVLTNTMTPGPLYYRLMYP